MIPRAGARAVDEVGHALLERPEDLVALRVREPPASTAAFTSSVVAATIASTRPSTDLPCSSATSARGLAVERGPQLLVAQPEMIGRGLGPTEVAELGRRTLGRRTLGAEPWAASARAAAETDERQLARRDPFLQLRTLGLRQAPGSDTAASTRSARAASSASVSSVAETPRSSAAAAITASLSSCGPPPPEAATAARSTAHDHHERTDDGDHAQLRPNPPVLSEHCLPRSLPELLRLRLMTQGARRKALKARCGFAESGQAAWAR